MSCARKKKKTNQKPKPYSSSKIYGGSKQSRPEQNCYFGQTAMLPPGESLKSPSALIAAKPWWGERRQAEKAIAGSDAILLQPGKAGRAGKL